MKQFHFCIAGLLLMTVQLCAQVTPDTLTKSDFVTGDKFIFFDDFSKTPAGNFPGEWITNSSGEIIQSAKFPGRWLQMNKGGNFIPEVKENFTDNFTIEFDLVPLSTANKAYLSGMNFQIVAGTRSNPFQGAATPGMAGIGISFNGESIHWGNWSETDEGYKDNGSVIYKFNSGEKYHVSFWVQKQRIRLYANNKILLDLPDGLIDGYNYNIFRIQTDEEIKPLIGNFIIATGN